MASTLRPRSSAAAGQYVGIDPSIKGTGILTLGCAGELIEAPKERPDTGAGTRPWLHSVERAEFTANWICSRVLPGPDTLVAVEGYGYAGPGLAVLVELGTLIRAALLRRGVRFVDVAPSQLKKFACGKGNAKKDEVRLAAFKRWGFEHPSNDVVDAYALARIAEALAGRGELTTDAQRAVIATLLKGSER